MKKHKNILIAASVAAAAVIAVFTGIFASSGWTCDVVKEYSYKSFKAVAARAETDYSGGTFTLKSPDGEATFVYKSQSVEMNIELAPFIAAGLDSLPEGYVADNGVLTFETRYSRNILGYHSSMGHFNIDFGRGNAFEWAQDIEANDKDIVFALNPEPFIKANVDIENISGWTYGEVEMHENGKTVKVFRLLKVFDLA